MSRIVLNPCAKINLYLRVLGRRPDGYHDVDSVLQTIALFDELIVEEAPGGLTLEVDDPSVPADASNLVWRAAEALAALRPGAAARLRLRKRIPAGAGLGGGSSDAAATLLGLDRLWGLNLGVEGLREIASRIGSDVPFFLQGGAGRITGRGAEVEPLQDLPARGIVIVFPGIRVSTRDVYEALGAPLTPALETGSMARFGPAPAGEVEAWVRAGNDLECPARRFCPDIEVVKERVLAAGASAAAMSGSGSAVFGIFPDWGAAARAAAAIGGPGWSAYPSAFLSRGHYPRALGLA